MDRILETCNLTPEQCSEIKNLETLCYRQDGLGNHAWLSNEINFDKEFPCFYLGYAGKELVAFLTIFIPTSQEAEIVAFTHPEHCRKGYFKKLYHRAVINLQKIGISRMIVAVEPKSKNGVQALNCFAHEWIRSEYRMIYQGAAPSENLSTISFIIVTESNKHIFSAILEEAFNDIDDNENFVDAVIKNPDRKGFIAYLADEPMGVFSLNLEDGNAFLYGVGILFQFRGKGLGKYLVYEAIRCGLYCSSAIVLDVDSGNPPAKKLYSSCGFSTTFQVDYHVIQ